MTRVQHAIRLRTPDQVEVIVIRTDPRQCGPQQPVVVTTTGELVAETVRPLDGRAA